jgi:hypothetical protein
MRTFVEKFVEAEERTELDLRYPYYESTDKPDGVDIRNEILIPESTTDKLNYVKVPSLDIDDAIYVLSELKRSGANRLYIATHVDHQGYYFYGTKLLEV